MLFRFPARGTAKKATEELAELEAADRVHKRAAKAARSKPGRSPRKGEGREAVSSAKGGNEAVRGAGAGRKNASKRR